MSPETIQADANATLERLRAKHPELTKTLQKAHGFAVFPAMGRAGVVLGGAYGRGAVYEQGEPIGFASLSQMTVGVQVGGQTFSELIIFPKKAQLDAYKRGKVAFNANASAVLVKAAASGTADTGGVTAHAYSRGGMLLELSLGGQKFTFIPPEKMKEIAEKKAKKAEKKEERGEEQELEASAGEGEEQKARAEGEREEPRAEGEAREAAGGGEAEEEPRASEESVQQARARLGELFRQHPIAGTVLGMGITGVGLAATALTSRARAAEGRQS